VSFKNSSANDFADIATDDFGYTELMKMATKFSDGIILDDPNVDASVIEYAKSKNIPVLDYKGEEFKDAYSEFYDLVMGDENWWLKFVRFAQFVVYKQFVVYETNF